MSDLKTRTKEIVEEGKAQRGNFEPEGVPLRAYEYWLKGSNSKRAGRVRAGLERENFCHFWRVVMFWAPFMAFRRGAMKVIDSKFFQIPAMGVAGLIAAAFLIATGSVMLVAGAFAIVAYALGGIFAGVIGGLDGFRKENSKEIDYAHVAVASVTAPVALPLFAVTRGFKIWPRRWNQPALTVLGILGAVAAVAGVVFCLVVGTMDVGWWFVPAILGGCAALLTVFVGLAALGDFIKGRRALARRKREAESERRYEETRKAIMDGTYVPPTEKKKTPPPAWALAIGRFFSGVGDFIVLYSQVVRVNKWKICPLVEVPSAKSVQANAEAEDAYYMAY